MYISRFCTARFRDAFSTGELNLERNSFKLKN